MVSITNSNISILQRSLLSYLLTCVIVNSPWATSIQFGNDEKIQI